LKSIPLMLPSMKLGRATHLVLAALLFAGLVLPVAAQSVAGTTWLSEKKVRGGFFTVTFAADGHFTETWKKRKIQGQWQADAANQKFTVTLTNDKTNEFSRTADGNLFRTQGRVTFKPSTASAAATDEADTTPAAEPAPNRDVPTVKLTEDEARAVVLIKGDTAEGTGFLVKTASGPVVVTNIHVISNNPNLKITTNTGVQLTIVSTKGATDRDLAEISIKDGDFKYLDLANDISGTVQPGDEVITPGNSEGGEVMLTTDG